MTSFPIGVVSWHHHHQLTSMTSSNYEHDIIYNCDMTSSDDAHDVINWWSLTSSLPGRCRRLSFLPVRILKFRFSHRTDRTGWKTSCQIDQALCNGCFWHQRFTKGPQRNFRNFEILKSYKHVLGRALDPTFAFHRKIQITRHAGGVRSRPPRRRGRTPRRTHRDRNGMRGAREPEENESGRQKNSLEFENRMNSKAIAGEIV